MKKTDSMKEMILVKKLKAEDPVELPMEELFFDNLHNKIMQSVEKTQIRPVNKWEKTWVFLERKTLNHRAKLKKAVKLSITVTTLTVGAGLLSYSIEASLQPDSMSSNKSSIVSAAKSSPLEWSELVINYQNENDFYADILSQRGLATIVEIDQVMALSL